MPSPAPLQGPLLLERFAALDEFLSHGYPLWHPEPFTELRLGWEDQLPDLARWLRSRSLEQAEASHGLLQLPEAPAPFPGLAVRSRELAEIGAFDPAPAREWPSALCLDVPGRKWQQIQAFAGSLRFSRAPRHWLDWCAGKGHLGRSLAHPDAVLTCLEFDPLLVEDGQRLSDRLGIDASHRLQDVMACNTATLLHPEHTAIALHACGDLHVRLLHLASDQGCGQLAVAPCCYNRIDEAQYRPLSAAAQGSSLRPDRRDLRLVQSETVTAGARVRRQRDQSMARRLAFDLLQREQRGIDLYLPTPSLPVSWLEKPFERYCHDLAELKGLATPASRDWDRLEAQGRERLAQVRNLELLRALFRRPLEVWLLFDRALFLQERGYRVQAGRFCEHRLTPRNLLLLAERSDLPTEPVDNFVDDL
ncbi:SAM-dependent methyltransferase [Pseudomonas tohonis]|uniref:SAM-dependent methyltransferase n=1 Tax=Pseudomonas tohonis TaxID=2725477 RepID=UPI0021D9E598|nr:SAM-dependent methyltransferase [Pseudomonas tohonis]UXY52696.1 SAM-dependent methyltransferase [Pseudomonas tohonis]